MRAHGTVSFQMFLIFFNCFYIPPVLEVPAWNLEEQRGVSI